MFYRIKNKLIKLIKTLFFLHIEGTDDLTRTYHEALEIRHRVNYKLIEETVTGLQAIHKQFSDYYWYATSKAHSTFVRVYQAMQILIGIASNDITGLSVKIDGYNDAYVSRDPEIIDDAFVNTVAAANSKISLFVQRLGTLTDIKFMQQFHKDFEAGNTTIRESCCETDYELCCSDKNKMFTFTSNDETLAHNLKSMLVELFYAGTEVTNLIDSAIDDIASITRETGMRVLPLVWSPGAACQKSCPPALNNISEAHSSLGGYLDDINSHNSMGNIYEMAFKFYDLQQHGIKAIKCRKLYSDALKSLTNGIDSIVNLINEFKQVSMMLLILQCSTIYLCVTIFAGIPMFLLSI